VVWKAKAFLREFHQQLLKKRLKQLKTQHEEEIKSGNIKDDENNNEENDFEPELIPEEEFKGKIENKDEEPASKELKYKVSDDFEPELIAETDADMEAVVDPEDDLKDLEHQRQIIMEQKHQEELEAQEDARKRRAEADLLESGLPARFLMSGDQMYEQESRKEMEDDEQKFTDEMSVPETPYWWHDKYRPRKPRYFNRVKTGYEWNKYNQTHYDKESPPPKIVQGYKFNIFYPDLIDPLKPPKYLIDNTPENPDYCLIRFTAGPPYEDVAFKIVNKEWEYSHKRGFKCVFDRGVLHLYFNFRRYRYRR